MTYSYRSRTRTRALLLCGYLALAALWYWPTRRAGWVTDILGLLPRLSGDVGIGGAWTGTSSTVRSRAEVFTVRSPFVVSALSEEKPSALTVAPTSRSSLPSLRTALTCAEAGTATAMSARAAMAVRKLMAVLYHMFRFFTKATGPA